MGRVHTFGDACCWRLWGSLCKLVQALSPDDLQADRGTVFMEMYYQPFRSAGNDAAVDAPGAKKANMSLGMSKKTLTVDHKGGLTVTLIKCVDLEVSHEFLPACCCRLSKAFYQHFAGAILAAHSHV